MCPAVPHWQRQRQRSPRRAGSSHTRQSPWWCHRRGGIKVGMCTGVERGELMIPGDVSASVSLWDAGFQANHFPNWFIIHDSWLWDWRVPWAQCRTLPSPSHRAALWLLSSCTAAFTFFCPSLPTSEPGTLSDEHPTIYPLRNVLILAFMLLASFS